jgi:hypothetical protein
LLAGCAAPGPSPAPAPTSSSDRQPAPEAPGPFSRTPEPAKPPPKPPPKENVAVASILQSARADAASGRLANAAASIERALRIEPRNPRLWNELARVRLQQRDYAQAEATAARSNSFAGSDADLRASNAGIIAQARRAQGK